MSNLRYIFATKFNPSNGIKLNRIVATTGGKNFSQDSNSNNERSWRNRSNATTGIFGAAIVAYGLYTYIDYKQTGNLLAHTQKKKKCEQLPSIEELRRLHKETRNDLPTYKSEEVAKHNSMENGVWVTYGVGVYDVTKFVPKHPGSVNVMLAAGSAIDPFWHVYQQHNTAEILQLLETFRIGNLNPEDVLCTKDLHNPWANEPKRHKILKTAIERPYNGEPPTTLLAESFITPVEFFYVRNHLPVPDIDVADYELEIEVENTKNGIKTLKLDDLRNMPKHTITAAIMCGGNRRSEMIEIKPVKGLSWGPSAVGNAEWTGVKLCDVLSEMGVKSDEVRHVQFEGLDTDPTSTAYGASIPLSKAMDPRGDVLLAYEMNGQPLSRDHGFPIRVIVPGVVGARNVKWLGRIIVSDTESQSHWQQKDYKTFSPDTDWDTVDFSKSPAIQNMPVTSAICSPEPGSKLKVDKDGFIEVKGYAWSGGGNRIIRVDITADGGKTWQVGNIEEEDVQKAPAGRHWSWSLWTAKVPIPENAKEVEIWSKAVDSNCNLQPEEFKNIWNLRGVVGNAYHRVKIHIDSSKK